MPKYIRSYEFNQHDMLEVTLLSTMKNLAFELVY